MSRVLTAIICFAVVCLPFLVVDGSKKDSRKPAAKTPEKKQDSVKSVQ